MIDKTDYRERMLSHIAKGPYLEIKRNPLAKWVTDSKKEIENVIQQ